MKPVAKFEKVSYEQFNAAWMNIFNIEARREVYDKIQLPKRATVGSAGYDFYSPFTFRLAPGETITIPTGIRVQIIEGWVLQLFPRSGLGFKYRLGLDNTVGIIDSDYYYSSNEGHIMARITNNTTKNKTVTISQGDGFIQGIFLQYGVTIDDEVNDIRDGGFGSTTKK